MTPGEHRLEAERLLEAAKADVRAADPEAPKAWAVVLDRAAIALRAAEVHARLAALPEPNPWARGAHRPALVSVDEYVQLDPDDHYRDIIEMGLPS